MTAPQTEAPPTSAAAAEIELKHFLKVKAPHTGLHLSPSDCAHWRPWWFFDSERVERTEVQRHVLFCRKCVEEIKPLGIHAYPMFVEYAKSPLDSIDAIATTACKNCGSSTMYAVPTLDWLTNDAEIDSTVGLHGKHQRDNLERMKQMYHQAQAAKQQQFAQGPLGASLGQLGGINQAPNQQAQQVSSQAQGLGPWGLAPGLFGGWPP